jgi:hypothetical protein
MSAHVITLPFRIEGKSYDVKFTVDFDPHRAVAEIGKKAIDNKSRRSRSCGGAVIVNVFEMQETLT